MDAYQTFQEETSGLESEISDILDTAGRHARYLFTGSDDFVPALESLWWDFDGDPIARNVQMLVTNATNKVGVKMGHLGEYIHGMVDRTGRAEASRIRRLIDEASGKRPARSTIGNPKLAAAFCRDGHDVDDIDRETTRLIEAMRGMSDRYMPAVIERDEKLWHELERVGFLSKPSAEKMNEFSERVVEWIGENHRDFTQNLKGKPDEVFIGDRQFFRKIKPTPFSIRSAEEIDKKALHALHSLTYSYVGRAELVKPQGKSGTGVLPVLDSSGIDTHTRCMERYIDLLERLREILKQSGAKSIQTRLQTLFRDMDGIKHTPGYKDADSIAHHRIDLAARYLTHPQFRVADQITDMIHLAVAQWKAHGDYIKASLSHYK